MNNNFTKKIHHLTEDKEKLRKSKHENGSSMKMLIPAQVTRMLFSKTITSLRLTSKSKTRHKHGSLLQSYNAFTTPKCLTPISTCVKTIQQITMASRKRSMDTIILIQDTDTYWQCEMSFFTNVEHKHNKNKFIKIYIFQNI